MLTNTKVPATASGFLLNCIIWTPDNYTASRKYPLIIFGHGSGEAGTDISKLYSQGLPNVLKNGFIPPFDCVIVCPQATSYGINPTWLPFILKDVQSKYSIDSTNIFLTGLSAGGWMCYGALFNVSSDYGKNFKAILPLSGATQDVNKLNYDWIKTSPVPVLTIVGALDTSYVDYNTALVNEINKRVANDAVIYVRPGVGHSGWTDIYNGSYKMPDGTTIWDYIAKLIGVIPVPTPAPVPAPTVTNEITLTLQIMSDGSVKVKQ